MARKDLGDLLDNPSISDTSPMDDAPAVTPYDKAFSMLATISGPRLDLMSRGNPKMAEAARVGIIMGSRFGSRYVADTLNSLYRFSASLNGEARREFVDSLKSMGASMPDAFFDGGGQNGPPKSWVDLPEEEE